MGWVRKKWQMMHNVSKLSHKSQNIPNKCVKVTLKITHFCEIFKMWFLSLNPGLHVQYKNTLKPCTLFATNCKYFPPIFSLPHQISLHVLPSNTFWCKTPNNQNLNFSLLKTTEKFHHNNIACTWPENPSNIMKIMYGHLWSNVAHFQDTAQNRTPCPKFWNFQIWTFCTKNPKMFCFVLLRPQALFRTKNTTNWSLSPEFVPKSWPPPSGLGQGVMCGASSVKKPETSWSTWPFSSRDPSQFKNLQHPHK